MGSFLISSMRSDLVSSRYTFIASSCLPGFCQRRRLTSQSYPYVRGKEDAPSWPDNIGHVDGPASQGQLHTGTPLLRRVALLGSASFTPLVYIYRLGRMDDGRAVSPVLVCGDVDGESFIHSRRETVLRYIYTPVQLSASMRIAHAPVEARSARLTFRRLTSHPSRKSCDFLARCIRGYAVYATGLVFV